MKTTLALVALFSASAAVAGGHITYEDLNSDGMWDMQELQAAWEDLDTATFNAIDADNDGMVSENELQAALDDGSLPK